MTQPTDPVRAPEDGRGGSSGSSGGRGRASSIIAGRRPGRSRDGAEDAKPAKKDEEQPKAAGRAAKSSDAAKDATEEERARPRRRRRSRAETKAEEQKPAAKTEAKEQPEEAKEPTKAVPKSEAKAEPTAEPAEAEPSENGRAEVTEAPPRAEPSTRRPAAEPDGDVSALRALVEQQRDLIRELRRDVATLDEHVRNAGGKPRLGVFVDVPNLLYGQEPDEKPIDVGKLLAMLSENRELVRATAYSPVSDDPGEPVEQQRFVAPFVPHEYRIVTKPLKRFADGSIKGNFDVEMAIDMITMADRLDVLAIVSGDADFARAVETVQARGLRVEVVAFARSTSLEMRALADRYIELSALVSKLR